MGIHGLMGFVERAGIGELVQLNLPPEPGQLRPHVVVCDALALVRTFVRGSWGTASGDLGSENISSFPIYTYFRG